MSDTAAIHITESTRERDYFEELRDKTFAIARDKGMEIVIPTSRQLQLDIDRPWLAVEPVIADGWQITRLISGGNDRLLKMIDRLLLDFTIVKWEAWRSSGGNTHVMLTLGRDLDPTTRIALQSMLGSDPMRELCNLRRVLCGADDPIALFRPNTSTV